MVSFSGPKKFELACPDWCSFEALYFKFSNKHLHMGVPPPPPPHGSKCSKLNVYKHNTVLI